METGSCLAEIGEIKEKEGPQDGNTQTTFVRLPKIGFFSSSVNPETDSRSTVAQKKPLPPKPPSRQGRVKVSTLSTQQLEIHINLSNVLDSAQAVTPIKRGETPMREEMRKRNVTPSKEETRGPKREVMQARSREHTRKREKTPKIPENSQYSKSTSIRPTALPPHSDSPNRMWERGCDKRVKEERPRTKTWPSLQYKLWLDASSLPQYHLSNDERANRPQRDLPSRQPSPRRSQNSSHLRSCCNNSVNSPIKPSTPTQNVTSDKNWSLNFLSVSRPPTRPVRESKDRGVLNRKPQDQRGVMAEDSLQVCVGGGSWEVASSYAGAHRPTNSSCHRQAGVFVEKLNSVLSEDLPRARKWVYPRVPSRMGPNNFEVFLNQNVPNLVHSKSVPETRPLPKSSSLPVSATEYLISPRYFCNTSAEVNLLTLRSYARNPTMLQELAEKNAKGKFIHATTTGLKKDARSRGEMEFIKDGIRHVKFKVPCRMDDEEVCNEKMVAAKRKNAGIKQWTMSDVIPPQTPPTFDCTFRISKLPHLNSP